MDDQISNETQIPPANPLLVFLDDSCRQNEEGAGGGDPENHHLRLYEPNWVDSIRFASTKNSDSSGQTIERKLTKFLFAKS